MIARLFAAAVITMVMNVSAQAQPPTAQSSAPVKPHACLR